MAKMTVAESNAYSRQTGSWVKEKCDKCGTPLVSSLTYTGDDGVYCSRECLNEAEPRGSHTISRTKVESTMSDEKKKKKKKLKDDDEKETKKKKKSKDEDDEEEEDDDEDEDDDKKKKSKKKSKSDDKQPKLAKNPFRGGSNMSAAFELAKEGTTRKKLVKFCEQNEIGAARIFGVLKLQEYGGMTWKYVETDKGEISIVMKKKKD